MKKYYFMAFAALVSLVMISCKKNDPVNPTTDLKVTVNPKTLDIAVGNQGKLRAAITPAKEGVTISFVSENEAVATVNASGLVTGVAAGTTNIIAKAEGAISDTCVVNVVDPYEVFAWGNLLYAKIGSEPLSPVYDYPAEDTVYHFQDFMGVYYITDNNIEFVSGVGLSGAGYTAIVKAPVTVFADGPYKGDPITWELNFDNSYPKDSSGVAGETYLGQDAAEWAKWLMDSTYINDDIKVHVINYFDWDDESGENDIYYAGYIKNGWLGDYSNGFFYQTNIVWFDPNYSYYFLKIAENEEGKLDFVNPYEFGDTVEKNYELLPSREVKEHKFLPVTDISNDVNVLKQINQKIDQTVLRMK